jgi:hypothetical protein
MSPKLITTNTLFYGDNLPILRDYIIDERVDFGDQCRARCSQGSCS